MSAKENTHEENKGNVHKTVLSIKKNKNSLKHANRSRTQLCQKHYFSDDKKKIPKDGIFKK